MPATAHQAYWRRIPALLTLALYMILSRQAVAAPGQLGDRLVLSINNIPFSQRQVEIYTTVKEALRPEARSRVTLVDASNWTAALASFTEDMVIMQEIQRLGSFTAADQTVEKYTAVLRAKIADIESLHAVLTQLGVDDLTLTRTLDAVLRVSTYRRNKSTQEAQNAAAAKKARGDKSRWLQDLMDRSVVRQFAGASAYEAIHPGLGGTGNGR